MLVVSKQVEPANRILRNLPQSELNRISQHLEQVRFEQGKSLYAAGDAVRYAYFPIRGLLSLVSTTESGYSVELAMVGNEGMVGVSVISKMPFEVVSRIQTDALRIKASVLHEEFEKGGELQHLMLGYLNTLLAQMSQTSLCHRFHTIEEALSRWLLAVQDRVCSDTLHLTQESISAALGAPRTTVTTAAVALQRAGLIRYSRGKIWIVNRPGLVAKSCECYRTMHDVNTFPNAHYPSST